MSLYLPEQNAVFLHVPKTGGTFIRELLPKLTKIEEIAHRHDQLETVKQYNPDIWLMHPFVFCFLRHPSNWYTSYWRYRVGDCYVPNWQPFGEGHVTQDIDQHGCDDLDMFVTRCAREERGFLTRLFKSYCQYANGAQINFVGRYERFQVDLADVLYLLGVVGEGFWVGDWSPVNVSTGPKCHLQTSSARLITTSEQEIIERFWTRK